MSTNINCASCGKNRDEANWYGDLTGACCHYLDYCPSCHAARSWCSCSFGRYVATLPSMALRDYATAEYYRRSAGIPLPALMHEVRRRELDRTYSIRERISRMLVSARDWAARYPNQEHEHEHAGASCPELAAASNMPYSGH